MQLFEDGQSEIVRYGQEGCTTSPLYRNHRKMSNRLVDGMMRKSLQQGQALNIFLGDITRIMNKRCRNKTERSRKQEQRNDSPPPTVKRESIRKELEREYVTTQPQQPATKPNQSIRIETQLCDLIDRASTLEIVRPYNHKSRGYEPAHSNFRRKIPAKLQHIPDKLPLRRSELTVNNFFQKPQEYHRRLLPQPQVELRRYGCHHKQSIRNHKLIYTRKALIYPLWPKSERKQGKRSPSPQVVVIKGVFHGYRSPHVNLNDPQQYDKASYRVLPSVNTSRRLINNSHQPQSTRPTNNSKRILLTKEQRSSKPLSTDPTTNNYNGSSSTRRLEQQKKLSPSRSRKMIAFARDKDFSDVQLTTPSIFRRDFL